MIKMVGTGLRAVGVVSPKAAGRLAFELWRRPLRRGKVRATEAEVHGRARTEIVDGVVTYAWGDGRRPVLLVHGWRSRASRFARFVELLVERGYSPVSYDAPGHGDSPGRAGTILDHERIIAQLAAKYGTFEGVIAHSLGVPFALYALRGAARAERVVALSGFAEFDYLADAFCRGLGLNTATNQALRRQIERRLFEGDHEIWTKYSVSKGELDLLSVHNDEDDVVDPAQAPILVERYGALATYRQTSGLGHRRIMIDPQVVAEAVDFIQNSDVAERLDLGA
jgi:alpha-beta hydrolase superfamily lysophospholipase